MLKNQRAASHLDSILVVSATFPDPHKLSPGGRLCWTARRLGTLSLLYVLSYLSSFLLSLSCRERTFLWCQKGRASARARYFLKGMANARAPGRRRWTRRGSRLRLVFISAARLGLDRGCFRLLRVRGCCGAAAAAAATVSQSVEHPDPRLWRSAFLRVAPRPS